MTDASAEALVHLLHLLADREYRFVTPTPATHKRVVARTDRGEARTLTDILGWSLPFRSDIVDAPVFGALRAGDAIADAPDGRLRSTVRVSSLHDRLFLHSAFPTDAEDSVFFGPDSYRFADLLRSELGGGRCRPGARIIDVGTGSGVGAIVSATACPHAAVMTTDVNPTALRFARINAAHAGLELGTLLGSGLAGADGLFDVIMANPPYIIDDGGPTYRAGGDMHGGRISLDMTTEGADRLGAGGRLILYTGSAILDGRDPLRDALAGLARRSGCTLAYRELDPDVFGEELDTAAYADVDRIALVAAILCRPL